MPIQNPPGARTRKFFVPAVGGRNITDSLDLSLDAGIDTLRGWSMTDNKVCVVMGTFTCPEYFISGMIATPVVVSAATGDCRCNANAFYGTDGETQDEDSDASGVATVAIAEGDREFIRPITITAIAKGDVCTLTFTRSGNDVLDDIGDIVYGQGFVVEYTADM